MSAFNRIRQCNVFKTLAMVMCLLCAYPALGLPVCCFHADNENCCGTEEVVQETSCCSAKPTDGYHDAKPASSCCCEISTHQAEVEVVSTLRGAFEQMSSIWTPVDKNPLTLPIGDNYAIHADEISPTTQSPRLQELCRFLL